MNMEHVRTPSRRVRFLLADLHSEAFAAQLAQAAATPPAGGAASGAATSPSGDRAEACCVAVGVHLCGSLAPRAIDLFGRVDRLQMLLLVPCCLSKRDDALLKAEAKRTGADPYVLKIGELTAMLEIHAPGVRVVRDAAMLTNRFGCVCDAEKHEESAAKNAILVGTRAQSQRTVHVTA